MEGAVEAKALKKPASRIWEIDFLRGVCVLLMVFDHLCWSLGHIQSVASSLFSNYASMDNAVLGNLYAFYRWYWALPFRSVMHYVVAGLFFVLSGISCSLSRNNYVHGLRILAGAVIFFLATLILYYVMGGGSHPGETVAVFNVLLALAIGVFLVALLRKVKVKNRALFLLLLGGAICLICWGFNLYSLQLIFGDWYGEKWIRVGWFSFSDIPALLIGLKCWGSDYFALLPYAGYTILGAGLGEAFYGKAKTSRLPNLEGRWQAPASFVGRHALIFYLGHQVVIWGVILICLLIAGYRF